MHFVNEHARLLTCKHSDTYVQTSIKPTAARVPVKKKRRKISFTRLCVGVRTWEHRPAKPLPTYQHEHVNIH